MNRTVLTKEEFYAPIDSYFSSAMMTVSGESNPIVEQVLRLVSAASRNGDVCIHLKDVTTLSMLALETLGAPGLPDIYSALKNSPVAGNGSTITPLVLDDSGRIYLHRFWQTQQQLVKRLVEKAAFSDVADLPSEPVAKAVKLASVSRFLVITGGPGAGKTTLVATVLASLIEKNPNVRISACAPTGKAAVRLREAIDKSRSSSFLADRFSSTVIDLLPRNISTIHKLLSPVAGTGRFRYDRERTLPLDVLVVDEASMVDLQLMSALFDAVPAQTKVILLGDQYQLSSIQPGRVLGDICFGAHIKKPKKNSELARSIVSLSGSYRFNADSGIGQLANAVNAGDSNLAAGVVKDAQTSEIEFVDLREPDARATMMALMDTLFADAARTINPAQKLQQYESARVLSAVNHGPFGVQGLNSLAEQVLQESGLIEQHGEIYESKPILIPQNDYSVSLFNGDTGVLCKDGDRLVACFRGDEDRIRKLPVSALRHHLPAYATTIHKSQGSEFDHVVVVLPEKSGLMTRELLYTAVTRARKKLTIFSTPDVIRHCVTHPTKRAFALGYHLWGVEEGNL